ncbi:uncharacterized protein LOC126582575 [Malus sylvestris]|uniref:uncharacterized protein LOC126582575 n=1 Tax=Malus sylvestris TaxID=3752 RepID=UPI0021ACB820|nr:uncharacterized protein LOC126582575 [Malus sylvestris]
MLLGAHINQGRTLLFVFYLFLLITRGFESSAELSASPTCFSPSPAISFHSESQSFRRKKAFRLLIDLGKMSRRMVVADHRETEDESSKDGGEEEEEYEVQDLRDRIKSSCGSQFNLIKNELGLGDGSSTWRRRFSHRSLLTGGIGYG